MKRYLSLLPALFALLLPIAVSLTGCHDGESITAERPAATVTATARAAAAPTVREPQAPPQPPPPGCPPCAKAMPDPTVCDALDVPALEHRCNTEMDTECRVLGGDAHLRVIRPGCWDGSCGPTPPPWAIYMGPSPCSKMSTGNEVQLYCW